MSDFDEGKRSDGDKQGGSERVMDAQGSFMYMGSKSLPTWSDPLCGGQDASVSGVIVGPP